MPIIILPVTGCESSKSDGQIKVYDKSEIQMQGRARWGIAMSVDWHNK